MVDKTTEAVRVHLRLSDDASGSASERERLFDLDEQFAERYGSGDPFEYDGHDIGEGFFTLYFYGDSAADTIASTIMAALDAFGIPTGSYFIKRATATSTPQSTVFHCEPRKPSNQAMQRTAGRSAISLR